MVRVVRTVAYQMDARFAQLQDAWASRAAVDEPFALTFTRPRVAISSGCGG